MQMVESAPISSLGAIGIGTGVVEEEGMQGVQAHSQKF